MATFTATERDTDTGEATGYTETYLAENMAEAVSHLVYTRSLYAATVKSVTEHGTVIYGRRDARSPRRGYTMERN